MKIRGRRKEEEEEEEEEEENIQNNIIGLRILLSNRWDVRYCSVSSFSDLSIELSDLTLKGPGGGGGGGGIRPPPPRRFAR